MSGIERVEHDGFTAVGFMIEGTWETLHRDVPAAWSEVFARRDDVAAAAERVEDYVGVSIDVTDGHFTEFVGIRVAGCPTPPRGMMRLDVPANQYLTCRHDGPLVEIFRSFEALKRHAAENGLGATEIKLDFGYDERMGDDPHRLYMAIEPAQVPAAAR